MLRMPTTTNQPTASYGLRSSIRNATYTLNFARRMGPNDWSIETVDDSPGAFHYTSLAYGPHDPLKPSDVTASISYRLWPYGKQKNPGLKFAYWDADTSSWILEMVDPGVDRRHNIGNSLAYDPGDPEYPEDPEKGDATIAYQRGDDTLKFFRRVAPGSWNSELVAVGNFRGDVSLAYDGNGNPSISFTEISPENSSDYILKFARWDGSSWIIEDVETGPAYSAQGSSLAYAADGTPYISYTTSVGNVGAALVKLAHRIGPDDWDIEIVTSCVEADPSSLQFDPLDPLGNPSVAYSDDLNDKLKLARIVP